jgi:hypothetical protein
MSATWKNEIAAAQENSRDSVEAPEIETVCAPQRNPRRNATLTEISAEFLMKIAPVRFHPVPSHSAVWCTVMATSWQRNLGGAGPAFRAVPNGLGPGFASETYRFTRLAPDFAGA